MAIFLTNNSGLIFASELNIAIFDHFDLALTPCDTFWTCWLVIGKV